MGGGKSQLIFAYSGGRDAKNAVVVSRVRGNKRSTNRHENVTPSSLKRYTKVWNKAQSGKMSGYIGTKSPGGKKSIMMQ